MADRLSSLPNQSTQQQVAQQERQKIQRYSRVMNPTFQSQLINMVMVQPLEHQGRDKRRRLNQQKSSMNYVDQLDMATREYEKRRVSVQNPESGIEHAALPAQPRFRPEQATTSRLQPSKPMESFQLKVLPFEPRAAEATQPLALGKYRSKSNATLPTFMTNDEEVYAKQSKPYNIITNNPLQTSGLRMHPKLSTEFKRQTYFEYYIHQQK